MSGEWTAPDTSSPGADIAAFNAGGRPSQEVRVFWLGVICDKTATLEIGPEATTMTVTEGPRTPCDAAGVGRGVVLTFSRALDARTIVVSLVPAKIIE